MNMLSKVVLAVVVAVAVGLVLVDLLGPLLITLAAPVAVTVGKFFVDAGWVIGLLCGLWFFFAGSSFLTRRP